LPNSPIHNPYIAKEKLNKQTSPQHFNVADLAFIVMLKDQLNQQLLILNRVIDKDKTNTESQKQLEVQQQSIEQLEQRTQKLQQQIIQLKNIERSINDHGTPL
jgi:septin family protein